MKKFKLLATALAAALAAASLAACGDEKQSAAPFNIEDYAIPISESNRTFENYVNSAQGAITKMSRKDYSLTDLYSAYDLLTTNGTGENANRHQLYDAKTDSVLLNGNWYNRIYPYTGSNLTTYSTPFFCLTTSGDSYSNTYSFCGPTGELLLTQTFDSLLNISVSKQYSEVNGAEYYRFSYMDEARDETRYLYYIFDEGVWTEVTRDYIDTVLDAHGEDGGYKVGDKLGLNKIPLADPEKYPDYSFKTYSYTREGSSTSATYVFYNGAAQAGEVAIDNGAMLGVMDDYFYFYEIEAVPSEAKDGYNIETYSQYGTVKANWQLYRYKFTGNGKKEAVATDFVYTEVRGALYNNTNNRLDKMVVKAYKKTDGVAVVSDMAKQYTVVIDQSGNVSADLSNKSVSSTATFYKLSNGHYLTGNTVVDSGMNIIAQFPDTVYVWTSQEYLVSRSSNNLFVTDFDGKIVIPKLPSASYSIFGNALVETSDTLRVYTPSHPDGRTPAAIVNEENESNVTYNSGVIWVRTMEENGYTYKFYGLDGTSIGSLQNCKYEPDTFNRNGKTYFSVTVDDSYITVVFS